MRPTVRGVTVALVAGLAIGMAAAAGARALNAIAAPAVVALAVGAAQVVLADTPTVERVAPDPGVPGETRTVELTVEGSGLARVVDALPDGVAGTDAERRVSLPATVTYEVELESRGVWTVGPPAVVVTDVLGLFVRTATADATTTLVVYPPVRAVRRDGPIAALLDDGRVTGRESFDGVREYAPGDPLRDVHWKSSAKRDPADLVVKQFVGERTTADVSLAASAAPGYADGMATAAASVADLLLSAGLSVGLTCPGGELDPGRGDGHRRELLELLARTGDGEVPDAARDSADAAVRADATGVTVTVEGNEQVLALPSDEAAAAEVNG